MGNPANAPITPAAGLKRRAEEIEDQLPRLYTNPIKLTAVDVDELIKIELRAHLYQEQSKLLDALFPNLGDANENILRQLAEPDHGPLLRNGPGNTREWVHLSKTPPNEPSLYQPWADIANKVAELDQPRDDGLIMAWRVTYDEPPISYWPALQNTRYPIKPDLIAELENVSNQSRSFNERLREPHAWCRVVIPAEFKKQDLHIPTVVQLIHYVRQSFREQPDRRFIIGIAFARRVLTVWYFDRSGVLGSMPFDVHSHPEKFIQVLLGLARMSATDLGFGPSFQLYRGQQSEGPDRIPSYLIPASVIGQGYESLPWVFSMPKKDGPGREEFITIRAISVNRAEVVRGRGTRIWVACRLKDHQNSTSVTFFVYKAMWKDIRRVAEGQLYAEQGEMDGVAKMYSYEDVLIGGKVDGTTLGRRGLDAEGMAADLRKKLPNTPATQKYIDEFFNRTPGLPASSREEICTWLEPLETNSATTASICPRVHCRLLLATFGYPLTYFGSLSELMQVFIDAVEGHRNLSDSGYLHRDISRGNIMITTSNTPNHGVLIDQDYAIPDWETHKGTEDDHRTGTLAFMAAEMLDNKPVGRHMRAPPKPQMASVAKYLERKVKPAPKPKFVPPRPIHDLESFFWVICWIFVAREGPATTRQDDNPKGKAAINAARELFGQTDLASAATSKRELLQYPETLEEKVVEHVAPCFIPLLPTLRALQENLFAAYYHEDESTIYANFLATLRTGLELAKEAEEDGTLSQVKDYDIMCRKAMESRHSNEITESPFRPAVPPGQGHTLPPEPESPTPSQGRKKPRRNNSGDTE